MDMGKMTFRPADCLVDDVWGKIGTDGRDRMEDELKRDVDDYFVREAIKKYSGKKSVSLKRGMDASVQV